MTSKYPIQLGLQSNVIYWDTPWAPARSETYLPELLQQHSNLETAMYGKSSSRGRTSRTLN